MVKSVTSLRTIGIRAGVLTAATAAIALLVAPVQAQTYDLTADFNYTDSNGTTDVWAYGFSSSLAGAFTPYSTGEVVLGGTTQARTTGNGSIPWVALDVSGTPGVNSPPGVAVGQLYLHPGVGGEFSVFQFIAPTTSTYALTSQFFAGDTGNTDITVFLNGNSAAPLFSSASTTGSPIYTATLGLTAGDVVSFAVGTGGDGFNNDSTPVTATFVTQAAGVAAPEPGSLALLIPAGLGVVGVVRRRRK